MWGKSRYSAFVSTNGPHWTNKWIASPRARITISWALHRAIEIFFVWAASDVPNPAWHSQLEHFILLLDIIDLTEYLDKIKVHFIILCKHKQKHGHNATYKIPDTLHLLAKTSDCNFSTNYSFILVLVFLLYIYEIYSDTQPQNCPYFLTASNLEQLLASLVCPPIVRV